MRHSTLARNKNKDVDYDREVELDSYPEQRVVKLEIRPNPRLYDRDEATDLHYAILNIEDAYDLAFSILDSCRILKINKRLVIARHDQELRNI